MNSKFILPIIGLSLACWSAVTSARGQGTVNFNNRVSGVVVAPVYGEEPGNPTLVKHGNTSSGTPAESTTYGGVLLSGVGYTAELWAGPVGASEAGLTAVGQTVFRTGTSAGFVVGLSSVAISSVAPGSIATLQVRAWDNQGGTVTSWAAAQTPGVASGVSTLFDSPPLTVLPGLPVNLTGLRSFNIHLPSSPPTINCAGDKTVECGSAWTFDTPTATASCGGTSGTLTIVSTVTNGICPAIATRTWQATDACGNSVQCSQVVNVIPGCVLNAYPPLVCWKGEGTPDDTTGLHPGTWFGPPAYDGGKVGSAFRFLRTNAVFVWDSDALSPGATSGAMTIEAWVNPRLVSGAVVAKGFGSQTEYRLVFNPTNGQVEFTVGIHDPAVPPPALPVQELRTVSGGITPSNYWHHLAGVYASGSLMALYVNGERVSTGPTPPPLPIAPANTPNDLLIGQDDSNPAGGLLGRVDEVCLYGVALDEATIQRIYLAGSAGKCPPTSCVAPPPGLAAWWPGNSNANDIVGGNNGTLLNGAAFASGEVGSSFLFDGVSQSVEVPASPAVSAAPTAPMSVALWAYRTGGGNVMHLVGKRVGCSGIGTSVNYQLALNMNSGEGLTFGAAAGNAAASGLDLPLNTWTHLAGTFDGTTFRLFINGELKAAGTGALGPENSSPLLIGGSGNCAKFAGRLDEVSLYRHALTPTEVQLQYAAASHGLCAPSCAPLPSGLLAWWPGEGNAQDVTGQFPGTVHGAIFAPGKVGQAFRLIGTNDWVSFGTNVGNFGSSDFTVEFWMQTARENQGVVGKRPACGRDIFWDLTLTNGFLLVELDDGEAGNARFYSSRKLNDDLLHHLALLRQSTTLALYVDGVLDATTSGPVATIANTSPLELGRSPCWSYDHYTFAGILDEVTLYTRALSAVEIQAIATADSNGKCNGDSDGDGLPDAWEMTHGLNRYDPADANADSDGDGMTNGQEYLAGTNPHNPVDRLALANPQTAPAGGLSFTLDGKANRTYSILYKDSLAAPTWQKLQDVPAQSTDHVVTVNVPTGVVAGRFFRVVTPQLP